MPDFLSMNGMGIYVWSSYGLTLLVLATLIWSLRRRRQQLITQFQQRLKRTKHAPRT